MIKRITTAIFLLSSILLTHCSKKDSATTDVPATITLNNRSVGASARELLSAEKYTSLKIEIQYMPGFAPDPTAINNMIGFLNNILNKPGGLQVTQTQIAASNKSSFTIAEITAAEKANRTVYTTNTELGLYILVVDAPYSTANVLGLAYKNTSLVLMGKTIQNNSGGIGQVNRTKLVTAVLEHELGHALGLVNLGTTMTVNHLDPAHGNHCNNQNCLMYFETNTTDLLGSMMTGSLPQLDVNCTNDLKANGGR